MTDKPNYEDLEMQIAELKRQIKLFRLNAVFQNEEKEKRAEELNIANIELEYQSEEKEKRAEELNIANIELEYQSEEKEKRAEELDVANIELKYQSLEKEKRAAELIIANIELAFQNDEKKKRAAELIIANIKLALLSKEKEKLSAELIIANIALALHYELIIAKEQAEESDKLKTAFLQNISHEIRTPMNAIIGFSEMLDDPNLSPEKRKSYTTIIIDCSNKLLSIITDILTISSLETKQEKIDIQKVCINSIIIDLFAIFKTLAYNQNISLYVKKRLTDKQSEIYTDNTKIAQILTNLITNALKFTHEGFIEFGYELIKDLTASERPAGVLQFYVKDTGIGIKTDLQLKIFERFRQADLSTSKNYGGTGLGLSISKGFVELLGGKIWVQSELKKGSIFYFTIPYKPVYEVELTNLLNKQNENLPAILVAEDDEYNYLFFEELLNNLDFKLIHAKNGKEAVDICKTNPNINLILMDIRMPIMDGHTSAKQIKDFRPDLIIIAQSAYSMEQYNEKYSDNPFDDYITKPINGDELKRKLMKYINIQMNKLEVRT